LVGTGFGIEDKAMPAVVAEFYTIKFDISDYVCDEVRFDVYSGLGGGSIAVTVCAP
jgi:hypothetical protein